MDRGAWQATAHRVTKKLDTAEQLNNKQHVIVGHKNNYGISYYFIFYLFG